MNQLSLLDLLDRPPIEALYKPDQIYESDDPSLFARLTEDARFDRKAGNTDARVFAKYLSAFGNGPSVDGGVLAIGVENDGTLSGCKHLSQDQLSGAESMGHTFCPDGRFVTRRLHIKNKKGEDDFIVLARINYVDDKVVQLTDGTAYERLGQDCRKLTEEKKQEKRIDKGERSFEQEPCGLIYPDDFDMSKISRFSTLLRKNVDSTQDHTTEQILQSAHLARTKGGVLVCNNACALLFARDVQTVFPGAYVHFLRYDGNEAKSGKEYNVIKDRLISGTVIDVIKDTASLIDNNLREFTEFREGKFLTVPEYPRDAWYEMLVNAVVHRSYHIKSAPIFVRMFDNRLEIESPGGFMPQITAENIVGTHRPRNLFLMLALREYGEVRCISEGTRRMVAEMENASLPPPEFKQERMGSLSVLCTLRNNVADRSNSLDSEAYMRLGQAIAFGLTPEERKIVNFVMQHGRMNVSDALRIMKTTRWHTAKRTMDGLVDRGALDRHGTGKARDPHSYYSLHQGVGRESEWLCASSSANWRSWCWSCGFA
ncbi:ATP dependent DNA helicase RecG [Sphingobium cloacae]|uniref:ATP dependent DNA helicase RecG n=2 Tax=Sphingobium cloacae TaxID=120107 RepID=A0A1E1EZP6_9SPHN|nr:ATP dependent DNA helicase RecG [Sphingobium cloacae]